MKVMVVVGTRPEIIRLSRVLAELDRCTRLVLVHTGQNYDYELSEIFFRDLGVRKPDHFLGAAGGTPSETIGKIMIAVDPIMARERPDALLVLGDTNSCLAVIPAKRHKIPVFHMEAGNRCFDQRVPEEINRRIVDHVADINLTYSTLSREYLLREGLPPDRIIKTGSPMREVLAHYAARIEASDVLERLDLTPGNYYLLSAHREENVDDPDRLRQLAATVNAISRRFSRRIVVSTHPRTRKRLASARIRLDKPVELHKPFGYFDYVKLQSQARVVLSDSGTITEESSILGFAALNLRDAHERPEGMEEAAVMMTGIGQTRVLQGLAVLDAQSRPGTGSRRIVADYDIPDVSQKVLRIILSYTDYVNRTVWRKPVTAS